MIIIYNNTVGVLVGVCVFVGVTDGVGEGYISE